MSQKLLLLLLVVVLLLIIVILIIILINKVPCSAAAPTMQCQTCFKSMWVQKFLCKLTAFNMIVASTKLHDCKQLCRPVHSIQIHLAL